MQIMYSTVKAVTTAALLLTITMVNATELAVIPLNQKPVHNVINNATSVTRGNITIKKESPVYVISSKHVNRIVTPFENPSVKLDAIEGVATKSVDNVLYLSTTATQPIAAFITEAGDETAAIKVILRPMPVAPQEIILKSSSLEGSAIARRFERSSPRSTTIMNVMAELVRGGLPSGYSMKGVNSQYLPKCRQSGLTFDFYNGQFVTGGDYVVSIGVVKNHSSRVVNFTENSCYKDGVVAVAVHPNTRLLPNERTEVFVMFYRIKPTTTTVQPRPSLIGG